MKNRLKVLRAERNWTQNDLAQALSVSRQTINAIETGKFDRVYRWHLKLPRYSNALLKTFFLTTSG